MEKGEEKDGSDLKPYKNDMDYLEDQFKLIMLKVKLHSIRDIMEEMKVRDETYGLSQRCISLAVAAITGR